ncbi:four-carbon acid sugar kinase family protein [Jiangella muralis]|uniref:four-carbon acid sugar kinase family protein n=1 Tax=Jiangella muralis TaxID=702383 RepID=UPI00069E5B0C|nr:four-carbon acid sugar kinase family protein [Jiangella muralis]
MISVLVVADDLTGAHASAESMRGPGGAVSVVVSSEVTDAQRDAVADLAAVVVCSTGTRNASPEPAAEAVRAVVRRWWPASLVSKRIDSTLRGPIGSELGALVRELAVLSGRRVIALACPAHPDAGRVTLAGRQHLHGVPLDASADSRAEIEPLDRSGVLPSLTADGGLRGTEVRLATVRAGAARCGKAVDAALDDGLDLVVFDSETVDDVERVAECARRLITERPDVLVVTVDPGPLTTRLYRIVEATPAAPAAPVLAVIGSASELTRRQLARLAESRPTRPVSVLECSATAGVTLRGVVDVVRELTEAAAAATPGSVLVLTSMTDGGGRLDPAISQHVPVILGEVVQLFLASRPVTGLLLTGGDVAAGVLTRLGASGVRPAAEVEPLAVRGVVMGGPWSGLPVVTKGGLVGQEETLLHCIEQLSRGSPGPVLPHRVSPP